jgi:ERCC4-type nuclease
MDKIDDELTILIDTREQRALQFPGDVKTESATLESGDYSARLGDFDLRDLAAIERKSISDLLGCIGGDRDRFERELARLAALPFRALVIEGSMPDLLEATKQTEMHPRQVIGSVLAWTFKYGVAPIFCSNRPHAAAAVRSLLRHAARYASNGHAAPVNMLERSLMRELRPLRVALCDVADVLTSGREKHPNDDGLTQPPAYHLERARAHLELLAAGDCSEPHLEHATSRLLMALEVRDAFPQGSE